MIGRVLFKFGDDDATATLGDDQKWTVVVEGADDRLNHVLTDDFNVNHSLADYSPADGSPGYWVLHDVARRTRGVVDAPPAPPTYPGLLY